MSKNQNGRQCLRWTLLKSKVLTQTFGKLASKPLGRVLWFNTGHNSFWVFRLAVNRKVDGFVCQSKCSSVSPTNTHNLSKLVPDQRPLNKHVCHSVCFYYCPNPSCKSLFIVCGILTLTSSTKRDCQQIFSSHVCQCLRVEILCYNLSSPNIFGYLSFWENKATETSNMALFKLWSTQINHYLKQWWSSGLIKLGCIE